MHQHQHRDQGGVKQRRWTSPMVMFSAWPCSMNTPLLTLRSVKCQTKKEDIIFGHRLCMAMFHEYTNINTITNEVSNKEGGHYLWPVSLHETEDDFHVQVGNRHLCFRLTLGVYRHLIHIFLHYHNEKSEDAHRPPHGHLRKNCGRGRGKAGREDVE